MAKNGENKQAAQGIRGVGSRIAPEVALLLLGDSAYAQVYEDDDAIPVAAPEPSTLGLVVAGAAVAGVAAYVRSKRLK
jgi:hypothetical protein